MDFNVDKIVRQAVFGSEREMVEARYLIWSRAIEAGAIPASINDLYMARGREELPHDFTVPAINVRGMAYDFAISIFEVAKAKNVGAFIFELARSEMGYTKQAPGEYATVILAAAIKTGWTGPVFIQCDHFQAKPSSPGVPKDGEIETLRNLISDSIGAGFYNVDIDMSTLVDLEKKSEKDQQVSNVKYSLEFAKFVREIEPEGVTVSLGGEIGHIGGVNSTREDFEAFMDGFESGRDANTVGMSKISVQTGSSHGGVVLPDGTLADVDVDFSILKSISEVGRSKYKIGGSVQHGASTLPDDFFGEFAKAQALEVHLATGFQNLQMDHTEFPDELRAKMYQWLDETKLDEKSEDWSDDQFHYKLRKKAWGEFKKQTWDIASDSRAKIRETLKSRLLFLFDELNVFDTQEMVKKYIKPVAVNKNKSDFAVSGSGPKDVKGLAD